MGIKNDLSLVAIIALAATTVGTSFHVGYFSAIRLVFISYLTFSDWMFASASLYLLILTLFFPGLLIYRWIRKGFRYGTHKHIFIPGISIGVSAQIILHLVGYFLFPQYFKGLATLQIASVIITTGIMISAVAMVSVVRCFIDGRHLPGRELLLLLLLFNVCAFTIGHVIAKTNTEPCKLTYQDGRVEIAQYLRFLGEAHLIRISKKVQVVAKDRIQEISCDAN